MAHKVVSIRVQNVRTCSLATKSSDLAELLRDYEMATKQYSVIVQHVSAAMEVLTKPECQLLLDFAEIEKNLCDRLHWEIQNRLATDRIGAYPSSLVASHFLTGGVLRRLRNPKVFVNPAT
jgi:hypothetical protein